MPIFVLIFSDFFSLCFYFLLFLFLFPSPPILSVPEDHEQEIKTTWPNVFFTLYLIEGGEFHKDKGKNMLEYLYIQSLKECSRDSQLGRPTL